MIDSRDSWVLSYSGSNARRLLVLECGQLDEFSESEFQTLPVHLVTPIAY